MAERATILQHTLARIEELARELGLNLPPSRVDLDRFGASLQRQWERRRRLDDRLAARAEAESDVASATEAVRQAVQALAKEQSDYETWCIAHGFDPTGQPDAILEAISELSGVREQLQALGRVEKAIDELEPSVTSFTLRCSQLFDLIEPSLIHTDPSRNGSSADDPAALERRLAELARRLQAATNLEARRAVCEAELASANCALEIALGGGEGAEQLRSRVSTGDVLSWASERAALEPAIEELRQLEEVTVRRHEGLVGERGRLASSDRIADLERRQDAAEVALDSALRRYLVLGTARALLQRTLTQHERERQPAVVASAAAHFARVTGGRYVGLLADSGGDGHQRIRALTATGEAVDAAHLSRGTIEQLYLCLRLGLADSFAERSVSLPIVLDDVLVNFDPERAEAVAGELAESARSHQIVFLTCHPHLAELVMRASGHLPLPAQLIRFGRLGQPSAKAEQLCLPALTALPDLADLAGTAPAPGGAGSAARAARAAARGEASAIAGSA